MECNKVLKIFLNKNAEHLSEQYSIRLQQHNEKIDNQNYPDSGFDLITPQEITSRSFIQTHGLEQIKLDTGVSAAMFWLNPTTNNSLPYYLYPRSSISKTALRMANSVGIIDAGYRGPLIGVFDIPYCSLSTTLGDIYDGSPPKIILNEQSRVLQVCSNDLSPFRVELVQNIEDLQTTWRGDGGFGSTGV